MKKLTDLAVCVLIWTARALRMRDSFTSLAWAAWWWAVFVMLIVLALLISACSQAFASQVPSEYIGIKDGGAAMSQPDKPNPQPDTRPVCGADFAAQYRGPEDCKRGNSGGLSGNNSGGSRGNRN